MSTTHNELPQSKHFHLTQLADGVYAAMSIPGSGSMCNAGIVDVGEYVLVFDTFLTPEAGQDLRDAAETLTGHSVKYVVNSHYNADHINGNQVFAPETIIISTSGTRELIETRGREVLTWVREHLAEELRKAEGELQHEPDPQKREKAVLELATNGAWVSALPTFEMRVPDVTFEQKLVFHRSQRRVELLTLGGGHTPSDSFLYLPDDSIAFMGDLLFVESHPSIWQDNPQAWIDILMQVEAMELSTVVPGHGPLGTRESLTILRQYFEKLREIASAVIKRGGSGDDAAQEAIPVEYQAWDGADIFGATMRVIYQSLLNSK